jgi:flagellar basal body P-ring formation protein FlgA
MRPLPVLLLATLLLCANASAQLDKILAPVSLAAIAPSSGQPGGQTATQPALHALTPAEVLPRLEKQLGDRFSLEGELKLETATPWGRILVPADYDLTIVDYPGGGVSNAFAVRCKLSANGQSLGEFQLPLRAQLWREVWVAEGRLDRGQSIDRSLVVAQKLDVLREHESLLSAEVDPTIYDLAQTVGPGRPLTRRDVSERPVIHKGEVVDVVARQGAFAIRMKALALENGIARELIKMRNLESRKDFTAEVINENQVEVHF